MVTLLLIFWTFFNTLLTLNVFVPFSKRYQSSFYSLLSTFVAGWLIGDLLPQWLVINFGVLYIFSLTDILSEPVGWGSISILILGWITLLIRQWLILDYPERIHNRLLDQLGAFWGEPSVAKNYPNSFAGINWKCWWNPNSLIDNKISILRDEVFFEDNDIQLTLDVYLPKKSTQNRPVLLQIHGGGWITGSKRQTALLMTKLAAEGWACFSVTYRFSPEVRFPQHLIDLKRALKWIRENTERFALDPNFTITAGGSAGGHLASLMALTSNKPEFQPGFEEVDTKIQGCVCMYGVFDFEKPFLKPNSIDKSSSYPAKAELLRMVCNGTPKSEPARFQQITPGNWLNENSPPFLLVQGETDALIPSEETKTFFDQLKFHNIPNSALVPLPLVEHAFDNFPTMTAQCIVPIIVRYLQCLHKQYLHTKEPNELK